MKEQLTQVREIGGWLLEVSKLAIQNTLDSISTALNGVNDVFEED